MGLGTPKVLVDFNYNGNNFKMIDEWSSGIGVYVDNKEIGRDKQFFAIPFISQCKKKYSFVNKHGQMVNVMTQCLHMPFGKETLNIYFNGTLVKEAKV